MKINQLTPSEEILMNILWKLDSAYMREVMEAYPEPKPHQNTISTFIKILVEKDFLKTEKEGRIFKYTVAVPFEDYRKFLLTNFIGDYFNNSSVEMIQVLLEENLLKPQDLKKITGSDIPVEKNDNGKDSNPVVSLIDEITTDLKKKKKKKEKIEDSKDKSKKKKKK